MKKLAVLLLVVALADGWLWWNVFAAEEEEVIYAETPMIAVNSHVLFDRGMPVNELPEGYVYIGDLLADHTNYPEEFAGCRVYASSTGDSADVYLYQECGTPISADTVDNTKRQWAYVRWAP